MKPIMFPKAMNAIKIKPIMFPKAMNAIKILQILPLSETEHAMHM
jgi:hypothetical protein